MEGGVAPAPDMLACDERCHVTGRIFHQFIPARHHSRGRFSHSPSSPNSKPTVLSSSVQCASVSMVVSSPHSLAFFPCSDWPLPFPSPGRECPRPLARSFLCSDWSIRLRPLESKCPSLLFHVLTSPSFCARQDGRAPYSLTSVPWSWPVSEGRRTAKVRARARRT